MEGEACVQRGRLVTKGRDLSTEGETCLLRGRLVYGGGGSSTEGETRLRRARLFSCKRFDILSSVKCLIFLCFYCFIL